MDGVEQWWKPLQLPCRGLSYYQVQVGRRQGLAPSSRCAVDENRHHAGERSRALHWISLVGGVAVEVLLLGEATTCLA